MDLANYLAILRRRKFVIGVVALVSTLVVALVSLSTSPIYRATVTLRVSTAARGSLDWIDYDILYTDRVMRTYAELAGSAELLAKLQSELQLSAAPAVAVTIVPDTELMQIRVDYDEPATTAAAANLLAQLLLQENVTINTLSEARARTMLEERLQEAEADLTAAKALHAQLLTQSEADDIVRGAAERTVALRQEVYDALVQQYRQVSVREAVQTHTLVIVAPATEPVVPLSPNVRQNVLLSLVAGLLGGLGLALVMEYFDQTLHSSAAIQALSALPILGKVPLLPQRRRQRRDDYRQEPIHRLATALLTRTATQDVHSLLLTSAEPHAGTTTVAGELAIALAQQGQRVLVIDANFRQPALHRYFGLSNLTGLSDLLLRAPHTPEGRQPTTVSSVDLLPAGLRTTTALHYLGSAVSAEVLTALAATYDLLLIDSSAMTVAGETLQLTRQVDGVLYIVARGRSKRNAVQEMLALLHLVDVHLLGLIVNRAERPPRHRRYELSAIQEAEHYVDTSQTIPQPQTGSSAPAAAASSIR
ncbi:MAG TPA: Wzz/FepE/Etk N-terminal domain-containing protein [Caldilineaceae bacterium]|nr:Wzz/FepE/Etk N-terminal domain-containing protein [Caldilineaceae bacterium]